MLLTRNNGSTLFADGDTPNAIVTYNFWREHRLIVVDQNRPRHFRLDTTAVSPKRYVNLPCSIFMTLMRSSKNLCGLGLPRQTIQQVTSGCLHGMLLYHPVKVIFKHHIAGYSPYIT